MKHKKKVCFACFTVNNIFTSYLLTKTVYRNWYKILILSDWNCKEIYLNIVKTCNGLWDEVILINEAGEKDKNLRLAEIKAQMDRIGFIDMDRLHYFQMNAKSYLNHLFSYLPARTKLIITVYTAASYYIKEYLQFAKEVYQKRNEFICLDEKKISEVWVYDKRLYIGNLYNIKTREIHIWHHLKDTNLLTEFCEELNKIFNYSYSAIDCELIFLDQAIKKLFKHDDDEKELFSLILKELSSFKMLVKLHPSVNTVRDKYDEFQIQVIKENKVPWEVILLNGIKNDNLYNKTFVTYYSESLFTTVVFFDHLKIPYNALYLKELLQTHKTGRKEIGEEMFDQFANNFKNVYGHSFYDIKSIKELRNIVEKLK